MISTIFSPVSSSTAVSRGLPHFKRLYAHTRFTPQPNTFAPATRFVARPSPAPPSALPARRSFYSTISLSNHSTKPQSTMYPPVEPYKTGTLKVSDIHTL